MAINRSALRKSTATSLLEKIKTQASATTSSFSKEKDERFWIPAVDEAGNGAAVFRILPAKTEDSLPFIKVLSHSYKNEANGQWYIEECPQTIGQKCPMCEENFKLRGTGYEADKELAYKRGYTQNFISNILVLKDPKNPENNGKLFLYKYGKKLHQKFIDAMEGNPELGDEPKNPYSFFDGAVVKLRIKKVKNFRNYDDTTLDNAPDLYDGDEEKLEDLLNRMYDLEEFHKESRFKSYDDLKKRMQKVLGTTSDSSMDEEFEEEDSHVSKIKEKSAPITKKPAKAAEVSEDDEDLSFMDEKPAKKPAKAADVSEDDEDDDLAFFKSLADE